VNEPCISVIIPAFNASNEILTCLKSISRQSFERFEIIVVDDGSTDNTFEICEGFAAKDPRLKVIKKNNQGVSSARNTGLELARGKYIYFADADDFVLPDSFKHLIREAEGSDADIVVGDFYVDVSSKRRLIKQASFTNSAEYLTTILEGKNHSGLWNKMFKSSLFNSVLFCDEICYLEDKVLLAEILIKEKPRVKYLNYTLYVYSINPYSASNSGGPVLLQSLIAHQRIFEILTWYRAPEYLINKHVKSVYRNAWYIFRVIRPEFFDDAVHRLKIFFSDMNNHARTKPVSCQSIVLRLILKCPHTFRNNFALSVRWLLDLKKKIC
tara:strand:+ start:14869 stop:15846 length:978 start_codon:yes stop_codon:yes gene_type:complete